MRYLSIIIGLIILSSGCRGPNEPVPLRAPGLSTPLIPGIQITDEYGNPLFRIGSPETPEDPTGLLQLSTAYPNPLNGSTSIRFALSRAARIQAWVVKGVGVSEQDYPSELVQLGNHLVATPGGLSVLETAGQDYPAGMHVVTLDMHMLPDGYYRCFIQADQVLLWTDLLLVIDLSCSNLRRLEIRFLYDYCY